MDTLKALQQAQEGNSGTATVRRVLVLEPGNEASFISEEEFFAPIFDQMAKLQLPEPPPVVEPVPEPAEPEPAPVEPAPVIPAHPALHYVNKTGVVDMDKLGTHNFNTDKYPNTTLTFKTAAPESLSPGVFVCVEGSQPFKVEGITPGRWVTAQPVKGPGVLSVWRTWHLNKFVFWAAWATPPA